LHDPPPSAIRRKASVRYEAADRTCREEVFNLADDILLYSSFVGGHSYVPSMNVDTAARSLAETLKLSRRKMGARRVELRLEAPPPARTPWSLILNRIGKGSCETHGKRHRI
jgi:hypothetical protein